MSFYTSGFFITEPVSNNRLDYAVRENPKIYVPDLIEGTLDDVQIGEHIAIEANVGDAILSEKGLKHFIFLKNSRVPTWICDNHNHAFSFWYDALQKGYIQPGSGLVHIDQHTDLGTPLNLPMNNEKGIMKNVGIFGFENLEEVEEYTNTVLTIADFIVPAFVTGLLSEALMITGEDRNGAGTFIWQNNQLVKTHNPSSVTDKLPNSVIVDLDLDYFSQGFDETETFSTVRYWLAKADIITIATSPLFIKQEKALEILKSLQKELLLL